MRAIIYARVSYDDRDTDGRNLAGQIEMGREYCKKNGYSIIDELAEDSRGASGAEINLPQLNKISDMARAGLFDVLVVRELDRLSRDVGKLYIIEKELKRAKVEIKYVLYDFPNDPSGQLMKNIYASFAQFEREEIRLRMMRGKRNKVKDGNILVSTGAPYGYRPYQDDKFVVLKPVRAEADIINKIFTWYAAEGLPIREIVRRLDGMEIPLPESGGRKRAHGWPRSMIFKILRSKTYIGEWSYTYDGTERLTVNVPPLIERDLWDAAQAVLDKNKESMARATKYDYLFGRRLTCVSCGRFMACEPQWRRGKLYLYYVCSGPEHNRLNACEGTRVRVDQVDGLAWNWLAEILRDPEKLQNEIDLFQSRAARQFAPVLGQLQITDELLTENRAKLVRLVDLYINQGFRLEDLQDKKTRLEHTIHSLEEQRANLTAALEGQTLTDDQVDELQTFASEIRDRLDTASIEEKKQLFHILNIAGMLEVQERERILHVQCIIRPIPDQFMLPNIALRYCDNQNRLASPARGSA